MNIAGTTLILMFWFPHLSASPQKQEHKVGHNYCLSLEKVKMRVIIISNKNIEIEIFGGFKNVFLAVKKLMFLKYWGTNIPIF